MAANPYAERNGWRLYLHPAFRDRLEELIRAVETLRQQQPETYSSHPRTKLLRRIMDLILVEIPRDPNGPEFNPGKPMVPPTGHCAAARSLDGSRSFFP